MSEIERPFESREPTVRIRVPVRPLTVPPELLGLAAHVEVRHDYGTNSFISGSGIASAAVLIEQIQTTITRQRDGKFHPDEAAHLLAEAQGIDARSLINRMEEAFRSGRLIVREAGSDLQKSPSEQWSKVGDILFVDDIDAWLAAQGVSYRFPRTAAAGKLNQPAVPSVRTAMMFDRLDPTSTDFRGGRIADVDLLQLDEAALMASRHAAVEVTVKDIVRAAARGEIALRAIVHQRAKVFNESGGVCLNRGHPSDENVVPAGSIPTLPTVACQHLANTGRATWRTFDGQQLVDGERWRFVKYELTPDTPSFETTIEDCRITGRDLHALADAFCDDDCSDRPDKPRIAAQRQSWYESTVSYIVSRMQAGSYATAKELYDALFKEAGEHGSPFDRGTDTHRGSLVVRATFKPVSLKTFQNRWPEIRQKA